MLSFVCCCSPMSLKLLISWAMSLSIGALGSGACLSCVLVVDCAACAAERDCWARVCVSRCFNALQMYSSNPRLGVHGQHIHRITGCVFVYKLQGCLLERWSAFHANRWVSKLAEDLLGEVGVGSSGVRLVSRPWP